MINDEAYFELLSRIEKLERKVSALDKGRGSEMFMDDFHKYSEIATRTRQKDKTLYKMDGMVYDKRNLVKAVILRTLSDRDVSSERELYELFPSWLGSSLGTVSEYSTASRYKDFKKRFFTEDGDLIRIGSDVYCISKDWSSKNIERFIENAKRLGLVIETLNDRRANYE